MASRLGFTLTSPRLFTAPLKKPLLSLSSSLPIPYSGSSRCFASEESLQLIGRRLGIRRKLLIVAPRSTSDQPGQVEQDEVIDSNVLQYCSIKKEKKSLGELESDFIQALQAFYYEGRAIMSNEEFDNLKEELMWEGSSVVMLSSDEQRFLEASMAYVAGKPLMNDEEFDELKLRLKDSGSQIVVEGPRCSLRSRKVKEHGHPTDRLKH